MEVKYMPQVNIFLRSLDDNLLEIVVKYIDRLRLCGHQARHPLSKSLGDGLFELRITSHTHIRIFYCFHNNHAYLLNAIVKKQRRLSPNDISEARRMMKLICN